VIGESMARDVLTQREAEERAARVSDVAYSLDIELYEGRETYRGVATVRFQLTGDEPLFLDFRPGRIESLTVNGEDREIERSAYRLTLPSSVLTPRMTLHVTYENEFDRNGEGFHRFVDPEDGQEYLFTDFEPFKSHRLFPDFDQPDIRATYTIAVTAPRGWKVVSNGPSTDVEEIEGERLRHCFETTPRFSPYLSAIICGPYHVIRSSHRGIPLDLYCRRSMARHLEPDAAEIIEVTAQGLDHFAELFDQPFPFSKWDQLFVPEYNAGAMENVGAVTFNESFIFRDPPTERQRQERAEVILHELCHAWFGDLTTMRWWNDLWLKESFATYVAYLALTEATRFRDAWKSFNADIKRWAYRQDQLITTHPVAGDAPDTEVAFLNFDGITYGKGASVLKQLVAAIGMDGFRDGMRLYFRRHAWGNATLRDFLEALEEGSGKALGEWARLWLESPSLDTLATDWEAEDGLIRRLDIVQTAPDEYPTLRPHALLLGLGREVDGRLEVETIPVRVDDARTPVPEAVGRLAPDLVFPNHDDHAYAKTALDDASLDYVRRSLERIPDALLRQLLWMSLWEMVRDRQLPSTGFLGITRHKLPLEPDIEIAAAVLERVPTILASYVPEARRLAEAHASFASALDVLRSGTGGDAGITWMRALVGMAQSPDDVSVLAELVDGQGIPGVEIDQDMRWSIAVKSVAFGLLGAEARVEDELGRDPSDRGRRAATTVEVARPTAEAKEAAWRRIHDDGYGSLYLTRAAMQGFFWPHQAELVEPYVPRFFERVTEIFEARDNSFSRAYMLTLFPAYRADPAVLERARSFLASLDPSASALVRQLREAIDELERAIAVRAFAEGGRAGHVPDSR
jgi:aminopeptidase N